MEFHTPFNLPFIVGRELHHIAHAVTLGNLGGDGPFTLECGRLLEERTGIPKVLLTPSCTAALELAALLCKFEPGDEVIMPSFTFVSTANAVVRAGARPVFVDIRSDTLNLDEALIEEAIGPRTRAIIPVHYAGVGCEMDEIIRLAKKHDLVVVEDAAQGVNASYRGRALGSMGQLGAYSFHETKNYICGEGGALCVNDTTLLHRAHILRDKGTNRQDFLQGKVSKYEWVDIGSSFIPSELVSAFLLGQLEEMDRISEKRRGIYQYYFAQLEDLEEKGLIRRPIIPEHCTTNYHLFYVLFESEAIRDSIAESLIQAGIQAITHFEPLHLSPIGRRMGDHNNPLPVTESVAPRLLRLPMFFNISEEQQAGVVGGINRALEELSNRSAMSVASSSTGLD